MKVKMLSVVLALTLFSGANSFAAVSGGIITPKKFEFKLAYSNPELQGQGYKAFARVVEVDAIPQDDAEKIRIIINEMLKGPNVTEAKLGVKLAAKKNNAYVQKISLQPNDIDGRTLYLELSPEVVVGGIDDDLLAGLYDQVQWSLWESGFADINGLDIRIVNKKGVPRALGHYTTKLEYEEKDFIKK
ncbi:MAG: hypothetical protein WC955_06480 [Elusimicrobiota bacterium]